jgi:hypothetical protein
MASEAPSADARPARSDPCPEVHRFVSVPDVSMKTAVMGSSMRASLVIGLGLMALPAFAAADEWELKKETDGIRVFTRDSSISGLKTVRAETVIPVDDPYVIVALLADLEAGVELLDAVSLVEEIESAEPGDQRLHMVLDLPWPLRDRDVVAVLSPVHDEENRRFVLTLTGHPELIPVDERYVRIPSFDSSYTLRYGEEDGVHVVFESTVDPGGNIPARLMNYRVTVMPVKTLNNMRRLVSREKYRGQKQRLLPIFRSN